MISCDLHDYIEIACMYRMPVELTLLNGDAISGIAHDVRLNDKREECIQLVCDHAATLTPLTQLSMMKALNHNSHFDVINFK